MKPVPEARVKAVLSSVNRQVRAMIELQSLTGMRPGEAVIIRSCDLEMSGKVWACRPMSHKTQHHGIERVIFVGPKAQEMIRPFLGPRLNSYLFSPAEAIKELRDKQRKPGSRKKRKKKPRKLPGNRYTTQSYLHAIHDVCQKTGIPCWGPNRLRHNAATFLRKEYGLEAAWVILGHKTAAITEVYAELDLRKAAEIMAEVG